MTFTAYIERQKNIIKNRHESDFLVLQRTAYFPEDSEQLFRELLSLGGLNTDERLNARREV